MADQSPFIEERTTNQSEQNVSERMTTKIPQRNIESSGSCDIGKMLMYGIVAILIIFILWMLWSNANASDGFIENTVRDDPAGDWNVQSEVAKLKAAQESILQKIGLSKAQ